MWHDLGEWIKVGKMDEGGGEHGFRRFKVSLKFTKTTIKKLRKIMSPVSPDKTDDIGENVIDLVCDVWGQAGPDCCTAPALALAI